MSDPQTPPSRPARPWLRPGRLLLLTAALVVLLGALHTAYWQWLAGRAQAGYEGWASARRAQGWRIEHAPPVRGGWPFSVTLRLSNFQLAGGGSTLPGGLDWTAPAVILRLPLHRPRELGIAARGPQRLRLGQSEIPFAADRLALRLPILADVLPRGGELEASRLRIGTAAGALEIGSLRLALDSRMTAIEGETAISLEGGAENIALPAATPLGRQIQALSLVAALTGPLPGGRNPTNRAAQWRDAGGTLELRRMDLRYGPATAHAAATLALDDGLQPMGAGTLRLTGTEEVLDALAQGGLVSARNAALARRVVAVLARPPAEGEAPQIEVPLTLERQNLAVARIPVARLPTVSWPGPVERGGAGP